MTSSTESMIIKESTEQKPLNIPQETNSENPNISDNIINDSSSTEFNRGNIENNKNKINLVDSDNKNNLSMFCYIKCNDDDNDLVKNCRGVVFSDDNLVMKAFPYTPEFVNKDLEKINATIDNFSDWNFFEAHEGTLLRVFCFNDVWFVSTHRKLDAFRSKWASKTSFGVSFVQSLLSEEETNKNFKKSLPIEGNDILERFYTTLDKKYQYMFLVRSTSNNRIVCNAPDRPTLYHVGTFVDNVLQFDIDINIPTPTKLKITNIDELVRYVKSVSYKKLQGVIGMTSDNRHIKVMNDDYKELFWVRGNEPSIKFRYLQVRNKERKLINMLLYLYPEMRKTFDEYENILYDIARSIYRAYVQRFIKKRYVTVPKEEFVVIRECHSWHLDNRMTNRISLNKVVDVLNTQTPTSLNHMIRRFKMDQQNNNSMLNFERKPRVRNNSSSSVKSFEKSPYIPRLVTNTSHITPLDINDISK